VVAKSEGGKKKLESEGGSLTVSLFQIGMTPINHSGTLLHLFGNWVPCRETKHRLSDNTSFSAVKLRGVH
jgi:hypothetical protein